MYSYCTYDIISYNINILLDNTFSNRLNGIFYMDLRLIFDTDMLNFPRNHHFNNHNNRTNISDDNKILNLWPFIGS